MGVEEKEKYSVHFKEIEEEYDKHFNKILPEHLHRGDVVSAGRLLGYADALMATCATFLVIPIRNLKELKPDQELSDYFDENYTQFLMFFLGFLVVCTVWESLNLRFIVIKRLDDFMVLLTLLSMLVTTVLPFSLAVQGHYPDEQITAILTCSTLFVIEVLEILSILYAFASPRLLHFQFHSYSRKERRLFCFVMCILRTVNCFFIVIGGAFCLLHVAISWVFISLLIVMPLIRKFILFVRRRMYFRSEMEKRCHFYWYFTKGNISKERVEAFTDAAVAIIACILILDITVEDFPKEKMVKLHGLTSELKHMAPHFYTFLATYASVSLLWYVNHTVLQLFHTVNVVVLYLQKIFLVFTCLSPFGSNMILKFSTKENQNAVIAVRCMSLIMLFASICNLLILFWGFHAKEKCVHKWALRSCLKVNLQQHWYIFLKAINIPFWSLICFFGSLGSAGAVNIVMYVCFGGMILSFIMLKLIFLNHVGKNVYDPNNDTVFNARISVKIQRGDNFKTRRN